LSVLPKKLQHHPSGEVLSAAAPVARKPAVIRSGFHQSRADCLLGPPEPNSFYNTTYPIVPDQPATTPNCRLYFLRNRPKMPLTSYDAFARKQKE
jgi:hypothetical protein